MKKNHFIKNLLKSILAFTLILTVVLSGCVDIDRTSHRDDEEDSREFRDENIYVYKEHNDLDTEIIIRGKAKDAEWELKIVNTEFDIEKVRSGITVKDALDNDFGFTVSDRKILELNSDDLIPGMPYTITLPDGVFFIDINYMMARKITFIVDRKPQEVVEYNDNVKQIESDQVTIEENKLILSEGTQVSEGEIIIVPTPTANNPYDSTAYKISKVNTVGGGKTEAETVEASIEEVFSELDITGQYQANPNDLIIDKEALESQIRESGLIEMLIPTAYASEFDPEKVKIEFKTEKSKSGELIFDIQISVEEIGGSSKTLVIDIILDIKTNVFIDAVKKLVYNVYVQNINSMSINYRIYDPHGLSSDDLSKLYDNPDTYLRELEDKIRDEGSKVLKLGSIPIPIAGPVNVKVEISLFFETGFKGGFTLGNNYTTTTTSGVIVSKKGAKLYSTKEQRGGVDKVSIYGYVEAKAGAKVSAMLEACRILYVGLELEGGLYAESGGVFTYSKSKKFEGNGGAEFGGYYELAFIAELNYFLDKINYSRKLAGDKIPFLELKSYQCNLRCDKTAVNVNEQGQIYIPEIQMIEDDILKSQIGATVSDVDFDQLDFSFKKLRYDMEDNLEYITLKEQNAIFVDPRNYGNTDDTVLVVSFKNDSDVYIELDVVGSKLSEPDKIDIPNTTLKEMGFVQQYGGYVYDKGGMRINYYLRNGDSEEASVTFHFVIDGMEYDISIKEEYTFIAFYRENEYDVETMVGYNVWGDKVYQNVPDGDAIYEGYWLSEESELFKKVQGNTKIATDYIIEYCQEKFNISPRQFSYVKPGFDDGT